MFMHLNLIETRTSFSPPRIDVYSFHYFSFIRIKVLLFQQSIIVASIIIIKIGRSKIFFKVSSPTLYKKPKSENSLSFTFCINDFAK